MSRSLAPECLPQLSTSLCRRQCGLVQKAALFAAMLLSVVSAANADIINGGFESGLTGWSHESDGAGSIGVVTPQFPGDPQPVEGSHYLSMANYGLDFDNMWVWQTFSAGAGDILSFDYFAGGFGSFGVFLELPNGEQPTIASGFSAPRWTHFATTLPNAGNYTLTFAATKFGNSASEIMFVDVDRVQLSPMSTEGAPLLPTTVEPGVGGAPPIFVFDDVPSGQWFDPPMADGFAYEMTGDSLFTGILDFPTGFNQPFAVAVGDTVLGQFGPSESVDFTSFPGGGVTSFQITGLDPGADPESPTAFPLRLMFDTNMADFTMQAILEVPEPSSFVLCGLAGVGIAWQLRFVGRRRRRIV